MQYVQSPNCGYKNYQEVGNTNYLFGVIDSNIKIQPGQAAYEVNPMLQPNDHGSIKSKIRFELIESAAEK